MTLGLHAKCKYGKDPRVNAGRRQLSGVGLKGEMTAKRASQTRDFPQLHAMQSGPDRCGVRAVGRIIQLIYYVVADALSRSPLPYTEQKVVSDGLENKPQLCAIVHGPGRCQSCWGPARTFLEGGGGPETENTTLSKEQMAEKATKLVREQENGVEKMKLEVHPGDITIKEAQATCDECIVFRQYIEKTPGAELPRWVVAAGLKPILKEGVICLAYLDNTGDKPDRILVPRVIRIPLIQRMHIGIGAGHIGYKRTLAKLRARYIWGTMAGDVMRVMKTCLQC